MAADRTAADYRAMAKDTVDKLLTYEKDTRGWKHIKTSDGVSMYTKNSHEFDGNIVKLEYTVNASLQELLEVSFDFEWLKSFDDRLEILDVVEVIDESEKLEIVYSLSGKLLLGLVSSREFVILAGTKPHPEKDGAIILHNHSIEHPKFPEVKGRIRGKTYASGRFMYSAEGDPTKVRCVEFGQTDAKVSIPKVVQQQIAPKAIIPRLAKFISKAESRIKEERKTYGVKK
ncbi:stAR-related lipid transfer protein 6-like [Ptychodera flava]|uniref:stAR-related lipid transfer protein 6-like n=1 Tax=Ptychodera flava TaxID=63121 RepID=UPI00396A0EB4